jgi:hydrogenase nickel incorporation protein HypA/HybF
MHERSLVQSLLEQISDTVKARGLECVREVVLDVGEFAGVDATLLALAFAEMAPAILGEDVRLDLRQTPLTAKCRRCNHEFRVKHFRFVCPQCGGEVDVTGGEDFRLVSLRVAAGQAEEVTAEKSEETQRWR